MNRSKAPERCPTSRFCEPSFSWVPTRIGVFMIGAVVALVLLAALVSAEGFVMPRQQPTQPQMVVFCTTGCGPCRALLDDASRGAFPGWIVDIAKHGTAHYQQWFADFAATVPRDPLQRPLRVSYVGPLNVRPTDFTFPIVWVPGSREFWVGYHPTYRSQLAAWLANKRHYDRSVPRLLRESPGYYGDAAADDLAGDLVPRDDFDGVVVIVTLPELSETHAEERAALANRVDRALQELVTQTVGGKVRAYFVARVADPKTFDKLASLTGADLSRDGPVVHVLIPERFRGMKAFLVGRVEAALEEHFLAPIRTARVNVVIERLHGGTYEACLAAVATRQGPVSSDEPPLGQYFVYLLTAWLSERSDLARRIVERFKKPAVLS